MTNSVLSYNFDVVLSSRVKKIMDYFSSNYEKEIGGFFVGKMEEDKIYLEDILFPTQEVSVGEVDITAKDLTLMRKEYGDRCLNIIGEWHSHNSLGCFWSGTDTEETIDVYMENHDIGVFIVSSKGEHLVRVDIKKPFKMTIDKLDYSVEEDEEDEFVIEMKKVLEDKIEEKTYTTTTTQNSNYGSRGYWDTEPIEYVNYGNYNENKQYIIDNRFYEIFKQDKKDFTISLDGVLPSWKEDIFGLFEGIITHTDKISGEFDLFFKFKDMTEFRKAKEELKGLVKILIDEDIREEEILDGTRF